MDVLTANNSSGIDACKDVKGKFPNTKVLIITGFDGMGYIKRGEEAKADGYITKDRPKDEILAAIKNVMEGKKVFPNEAEDEETDSNNLTSKEQEVLFYVCEGLTRSEIAEKMFISEATVKTHLGNLFSKTNTRNRTELAIYAVTNGYVENIKK
jgi:DNA-binding NarL/FixJ family response regulator